MDPERCVALQQPLSINTECEPESLQVDIEPEGFCSCEQPDRPLMDTLGGVYHLSDAASVLIADVAFAAATIASGDGGNGNGACGHREPQQIVAGNQCASNVVLIPPPPMGRGGPGDPSYNEHCATCNPTYDPSTVIVDNSYTVQVNFIDENIGYGLRAGMSVIFVAGEMAGIGVIIAPWAAVNLGWMGFLLLLAFSIATAYSTLLLGTSWLILEERFYECRQYPCEDPYATIAYHAVGYKTSIFTKICIHVTLFGAATVYLMVIAQSTQKLFLNDHPEVSFCTWLVVFATAISSLMFMESPKNFGVVAIGALLATMTACYFIIMQIILDNKHNNGELIPHKEWDVQQFFLSFGTILFAFSSATAFPTIQNNLFKRNDYSHSVVATFMMLGILFTAVVVGGYVVYGNNINPNVLLSLGDSWFSFAAIMLMCAHLILGFLIIINPVSQNLENLLSRNTTFRYQRFLVRVSLLILMILLGETIPNFTDLIALFGSSTIMLATFVLPSIFYLNLCSKTSSTWPNRQLSWKSKFCIYTIIVVSVTGGVVAVCVALNKIVFTDPLAKPCYWNIFSVEKLMILDLLSFKTRTVSPAWCKLDNVIIAQFLNDIVKTEQ